MEKALADIFAALLKSLESLNARYIETQETGRFYPFQRLGFPPSGEPPDQFVEDQRRFQKEFFRFLGRDRLSEPTRPADKDPALALL